MRCIASMLLCYAFICLGCLSCIIGGFWRVLVGVRDVCRVAFPLVMLSRSIFSLVLAFRVFGCILDRVRAFSALVSRFGAFDGCDW